MLRPLKNNVLIRINEAADVTRGGIFIPSNAKEKQTDGVVVATGPGKILDNGKLVEPSVKKGDTVIFGRYAGHEVTVDGEKLLLVNEDDIQGVVEE